VVEFRAAFIQVTCSGKHSSNFPKASTLTSKGVGVPQDYVQGHKWFILAATKHAKYRANRDLLAKRMTPAQIAEAQRLARQWKPKK
jgi:TPR repeat protein